MAYASLQPSRSLRRAVGLGCPDCGGTCGGQNGVAAYVPNSWQQELAAYSLGGLGDLTNPSTLAILAGAGLLAWWAFKKSNRRRRSRAALRRVKGE